MKRYATTLILAGTLFIGELHTFWEKSPETKLNWIITRYEPMTMQWNVKMVCDELNVILYFIAMWFFAKYPNRLNKTVVSMFIGLAIMDMAIYFWNFKTVNYHYVYFGMALLLLFIFRKNIKQRLFG